GQDLIFGLGDEEQVRQVKVIWPDGRMAIMENVAANRLVELTFESSTLMPETSPADAGEGLFVRQNALLDQPATHQEEFFNDFDYEGLLLRQLSTPGPKIVKGDPNGDGREDFVLLGSAGDPDKLYLQQADGRFRFTPNNMFTSTAQFESTCGAFFDADGDGDDDLMVGSGGNEFSRGFQAYAIRYYENVDGQLIYNQLQAPLAGGEISCILPEDIDLDGDIDLFIGGRAVPNNYGLIPQSFLFVREAGQWVNQTPDGLGPVGMVTGGAWTDLNGDKRPDLVLVGDWMPVTVMFTLNDARISELFQIPNTSGLWTNLTAADLDGDGLEDLIATNWGENTTLSASTERPLSLFTKDFDGNEKSEFIINWYPPADNQPYPFASKRDLHKQLPHLRKR
ncbi:MAG: FG-GAP-like repeat-containing protein, partial [Bacteroidota bacterium]